MYGATIKKWRKEQGLSQGDLAEKTGFPQTSISTWEKSTYPPLEFIEKSIQVLKPGMMLWQFFAPDDLVLPQMSEAQLKWIQAFNDAPEDLQVILQEAMIAVLRAYRAGRSQK